MDYELLMRRCFYLAQKGSGKVAPNPMVGAILIHDGQIIGEGWHQQYGQAHAEVNCIKDAEEKGWGHLLSTATMLVSLEPCAHYGKTPPCARLLIEKKIPEVIIACSDSFAAVNGKGVKILQENGVKVVIGVLEKEARELNKRFFHFHTAKSPYIILKWAQTASGVIGDKNRRLFISNEFSNRLVHKWRSEEAAILVGKNTFIADSPLLTNRLWTGRSPIRMTIDPLLQQDAIWQDKKTASVIWNTLKEEQSSNWPQDNNILYKKTGTKENFITELLEYCYTVELNSLIVEGGANLLQQFIEQGCWNEARIITATTNYATGTVLAPRIEGQVIQEKWLEKDRIQWVQPYIN